MFSPLIFKMAAVRLTPIHKEPRFLMQIELILSIFVWSYISTFCHELGHFVCARLVGMSPHLMRVGRGYRLCRKHFFGAQIELGILPFDGVTRAYGPTNWSTFEDLKPNLIIFYLGGCLANSALLVWLMAMFAHTRFPIFMYFILVEVGMIIVNLIPVSFRSREKKAVTKTHTDGKQIFFILTKNYQQCFLADLQKYITRMDENLAGPQILFKNDTRTMELFVKAETELAYCRYDEAIALYNLLLNGPNVSGAERVYILDILVSIVTIYGQKQYLPQADVRSQEAMKLAGYSKTIQATRGAILIELGKHEEGMRMLFRLTEPDNDPLDVAISGYYLAKAEHRLGNDEKVWSWFKLAEEAGKQASVSSDMFAHVKQELHEPLN
jgi:peptidase M50-like protein